MVMTQDEQAQAEKPAEVDSNGAHAVGSGVAITPKEPGSEVIAARAAMALGVALFVAILVGLGIQGDLLIAMIRNSPWGVAIGFSVILVGLALPFFTVGGVGPKYLPIVAVLLLVGGAIMTVFVAANSYSVRERPTLALTASNSSTVPLQTTIGVKASATSLLAQDSLAIRVIGYSGEARDAWGAACAGKLDAETLPGSELLYLGGSGPTKSGAASIEVSIPVDSGKYDYVCVLANLTTHANDKNRSHFSRAVLSLG
jgi:hypothetical protein